MTTASTPVTPYLEAFLNDSLHEQSNALKDIFDSGDKFGQKAMQISWLQAAFLQMIVKLADAKCILEVGTYVGFSASVIATASPSVESVTTCEVVEKHYQLAQENILKHALNEKITPLLGDAKQLFRSTKLSSKKFDLFFLDGDKENYDHYLDIALAVLPPGGLFIVDNILFKGELLGGASSYSKGIRRLFDDIRRHPCFDLSHITIGDGMLVARRR
jgi:caffeoyl-CoA O-methyltransferase